MITSLILTVLSTVHTEDTKYEDILHTPILVVVSPNLLVIGSLSN